MSHALPGLEAARKCTVRICDHAGRHIGQGLILHLDNEGDVVLTCHHVVAQLSSSDLYVMIPQRDGQLRPPAPAQYDASRSHPAADAVVLRMSAVSDFEQPLLHELNHQAYAGRLAITGMTQMVPGSFDATLSTSVHLDIQAPTNDNGSDWPDWPKRYLIPVAYRLAYATDARPGISGAVVVCEEGVLGLTHFARETGPTAEREAYLVPLSTWADKWPALGQLIVPFIDRNLRQAAKVKRARDLEITGDRRDLVIEGYRPDLFISRKVVSLARDKLNQNGLIIIGKPKSGKTRLAFELMAEQPERIVIIPISHTPPDTFEPAGLYGKHVTIILDDIHWAPEASDLTQWRWRISKATGNACKVIVTSRDGDDWKRVRQRHGALLRELDRSSWVYTSRGEQSGEDLSVEQGMKLAEALGIDSDDFERRFDGTPGSLTLDLNDMRVRYQQLREEEHDGVPVSLLLDSAKLLHIAGLRRLGTSLLRAVGEQILNEERIRPSVWATLERRTQEEGFGQLDIAASEFQIYRPYLEECVTFEPGRKEAEALLSVLAEAKDATNIASLAEALHNVYNSPLAERASRIAIEGGEMSAYSTLGSILSDQPEREEEAEDAYRASINAGYESPAYHNLANLLAEQSGREKEAEAAYHAAIAIGDGFSAYVNLGNLLAKQAGREKEAEDAYRSAIDLRSFRFFAYYNLGILLARLPNRKRDAEKAFRAALNAASEDGFEISAISDLYVSLGNLLVDQTGRESEAEEAYRTAIEAGNVEANLGLVSLIVDHPERKEEAEQLVREAIEAGVTLGHYVLGVVLLTQEGREKEACEALHKAKAAGIEGADELLREHCTETSDVD